jgi:hypothetical protein
MLATCLDKSNGPRSGWARIWCAPSIHELKSPNVAKEATVSTIQWSRTVISGFVAEDQTLAPGTGPS